MADRLAVTHSIALHMGVNCGLVNELNAQKVFDKMIETLKQPVSGYFYADDVSKFFENDLSDLIAWADGLN